MSEHPIKRLLREAKEQGFDKAEITEDDTVYIECSQCEALCINNVACHERGCPNIPREPPPEEPEDWDEDDFDPFAEPFDTTGEDEPTEYDELYG